jgi:membrane-bound serine protease (ClpP class)
VALVSTWKEVQLTLGPGIALLVAGTALLVLEAHVVSYGILGMTGLAAMVAGAALAIDGAGGGLTLVVAVAVTLALVGSTLLLGTVRRVARVARRRARTGAEALVGRSGVVRSSSLPFGQVFVDGALWRARVLLDEGEVLRVGDLVVVERVSGLTLGVRRAEEWELEP